jgi:hypothetical protein
MLPCRRVLVRDTSALDGTLYRIQLADLEACYILDEHVARMRILSNHVRQNVVDQMNERLRSRVGLSFSRRIQDGVRLA